MCGGRWCVVKPVLVGAEATGFSYELRERETISTPEGGMVASCAVAAGAAGTRGTTLLAGGSTGSIPVVSVLLELPNECTAELGAE